MDIRLKDAMLEYHRGGPVYVLSHPARMPKPIGFLCVGAAFADWNKMTPEKRLLQLYIDAWHAVVRDGVPPEQMHKAISVIPEYRDSLAEDVPV
jgi:hypothetical protein